MFWINTEKSIKVASVFLLLIKFSVLVCEKSLLNIRAKRNWWIKKRKDGHKLEDKINSLLELKKTQRVYIQEKKTRGEKKFVCSLALAMASEKDLYPSRGQAWQKGGDRGSVAHWGLSATHKSPTWKSYKDWHWLWHHAIDRLCGNEGKTAALLMAWK